MKKKPVKKNLRNKKRNIKFPTNKLKLFKKHKVEKDQKSTPNIKYNTGRWTTSEQQE
jgi:hypothetical protein